MPHVGLYTLKQFDGGMPHVEVSMLKQYDCGMPHSGVSKLKQYDCGNATHGDVHSHAVCIYMPYKPCLHVLEMYREEHMV